MRLKDMKITAKLTISAAAFLLPLGILLYIIISTSHLEIEKGRTELKGIETLRPALSLMQVLPLYARYAADNTEWEPQLIKQNAQNLLTEFTEKYEKNFGNAGSMVSVKTLTEYWNFLSRTDVRDTVLWAYKQYFNDLCRMAAYIGDISGLISDPDLECVYLVMAAIHEVVQAQARIVSIENSIRLQSNKDELIRDYGLLVYSDNARIINRFNSALTIRSTNTELSGMLENLLRICYEKIEAYSNTLDSFINAPLIDNKTMIILNEASTQVNNAAFQLQNTSLNRMETIIKTRISEYQKRLIASLAAAILSSTLAFVFIFAITRSIKKSTNTMAVVFKRLDEDDLSVKIKPHSLDELGKFMLALSHFLDKLNAAFSTFSRNAEMVSTAAFDLSSSAVQISATATEQSASVYEIVSTMENNQNLAAEAAAKTNEVAVLANRTRELSLRGAELRDANENMMLDIKNQNAKIVEVIENLSDVISRIDESIQLIDTIADQTKLIAFNAALEASSSGESGSRFAVVATEIRRFADNVADYVNEIKERISELHTASAVLITEADSGSRIIDSGYNRMVEQKDVFDGIVEVAVNVADHSRQISNLSKQQETAAAQVFSALKEISAGTSHFASATSMAKAAVDKLNKMSDELKEILAKYKTVNTDAEGQEWQ
jgi:methyl-accepting chemotaxis protein